MTAEPASTGIVSVWRPHRPVDLVTTLGPLSRGGGDPAFRTTRDGAVWRTSRTPCGPATLRLAARCGEVHATAWGPGAGWLVDSVPDQLGAGDDPTGFVADHPLLRRTFARHPGLRIPRTGLVFEVLVPSVLEQKVTGIEARRAWRDLVRWYGEPAPGPAPAGMRVPPDARTWARVPSWAWHRAGVDAKRSRTIVTAARLASRLEEAVAMSPSAALTRLMAVPGVGPWTAAEVAQRALGDADAVSVGDLHLPRLVGWALAGRPFDDAAMLAALADYTPHRHRVTRLVELAGLGMPRFRPRHAVRDFRSW